MWKLNINEIEGTWKLVSIKLMVTRLHSPWELKNGKQAWQSDTGNIPLHTSFFWDILDS